MPLASVTAHLLNGWQHDDQGGGAAPGLVVDRPRPRRFERPRPPVKVHRTQRVSIEHGVFHQAAMSLAERATSPLQAAQSMWVTFDHSHVEGAQDRAMRLADDEIAVLVAAWDVFFATED